MTKQQEQQQHDFVAKMKKSGRKIPPELQTYIDNVLLDGAYVLNPIFNRMGFTPNGITTLSLISGLMCVYFYYHKQYLASAICWMISYFFDCQDGNYARRYNMQSKFGDYYDHIKDNLVFGIFLVLFFIDDKLGWTQKGVIIAVISTLAYLAIKHQKNVEKYVKLSKLTHIMDIESLEFIYKKNENNKNNESENNESENKTDDIKEQGKVEQNLLNNRWNGFGLLNLFIASAIAYHSFF